MQCRIQIRMDNAAFNNNSQELPFIMLQCKAYAIHFADGGEPDCFKLTDSNGNAVGTFEIIED